MEKCSDIMTKNPVCCLSTESAVEAARLMRVENVGSIPVVENKLTRIVIGIITDRDLALKVVGEGRDPETVKVQDVMTHGIITCYVEDDVQMALNAMAEYQLRRIPIVDSDHRIVGIISQADIATHINQPEKTAAVVKEISQ